MLISCEVNTRDFKRLYDLFQGAIFNRLDKGTGKLYVKLTLFKINYFEEIGIKFVKP